MESSKEEIQLKMTLPLQEFLSPVLVEILFPQYPAIQPQYMKIFAQNFSHGEPTKN